MRLLTSRFKLNRELARAHKGRTSCDDLNSKFTNVANTLKEKSYQCENWVKEVDLEKKESEDVLKHAVASVYATIEEVVTRIRAEA